MKLTLIKEAVQDDEQKKEQETKEDEEDSTEVETTEPIEAETEDTENEDTLEPEMPVEETPVEMPQTGDNELDGRSVVVLSDITSDLWRLIDTLKSFSLKVEVNDLVNKAELKELAQEVQDDLTISVGMMYKLIQLYSVEVNALVGKGQNTLLDTSSDLE